MAQIKFRVEFNRHSLQWEPNIEYNKTFLYTQHQYLSQCLKRKGVLFVNEVLDLLGMERVQRGVTAGWVASDDFFTFENVGWNEKTGDVVFDLTAQHDIRSYLKEG